MNLPSASKISTRLFSGVGDVNVVVFVQRNALRRGEIARRRQCMLLAAGADAAQQFQVVSVKHQHLVLLGVDHVEQAIFGIDRDPNRDQPDLL